MTNGDAFLRSKTFSYVLGGVVVTLTLGIGLLQPATGPAALGPLPNDGTTRLVAFDVGQGDALLVRTASGEDIVIDGGPDDRLSDDLERLLPPEDRDIELMVLTHPHADHLAGFLGVLENFTVRRVVHSGMPHNTAIYNAFVRAVTDEGVPLERAHVGDIYRFGTENFTVLASGRDDGDLNDASVVLRLTAASSSALLMGDATAKVEEVLLKQVATSTLRAAVLKVGHHGSKYSTSREFLAAVLPDLAVISVGKDNTYGHPAERTLKRLRDAGVTIKRTDKDGTVVISFTQGSAIINETQLPRRRICDSIPIICNSKKNKP